MLVNKVYKIKKYFNKDKKKLNFTNVFRHLIDIPKVTIRTLFCNVYL